MVVVAAAGNRGSGTSEVGAPATIPGVLTVAGVDARTSASSDASSRASRSRSRHPARTSSACCPTEATCSGADQCGAPIVSGLVALVRSEYPELDAANVIERLIRTADPHGHEVPSPLYGWGIIDPVPR